MLFEMEMLILNICWILCYYLIIIVIVCPDFFDLLTLYSRFVPLCPVIESFSVLKCDYYSPVYLFIFFSLKEKALRSLSISNSHNLLICLGGIESLWFILFDFLVFLLFEVQHMQQIDLSEIILKGNGKLHLLRSKCQNSIHNNV